MGQYVDLLQMPVGAGHVGDPGARQLLGQAALMLSGVGMALIVSLAHSAAMMAAGLLAARVVYRHLGLRVLRAAWLDLDVVWALSLMASGGAALAMALGSAPGAGA